MTEELKSIQDGLDKILKDFDGIATLLHRADMITESALLKLSEDRVDYIAHRVEQKILEISPITELEQQEHDWESDSDR